MCLIMIQSAAVLRSHAVNSETSLFQSWLADQPAAQVAILAFGNLISELLSCFKSMQVRLLHLCFH